MRYLAIDYGEKRIGVAITDPLKIFVTPFTTIEYKSEKTMLKELLNIFKNQEIEKIIIGLPINLEGNDTIKTTEVRTFHTKLSKITKIPLVLWDERYSTSDANDFLKQKGLNWKESRKQIDQIAAAVILKNFLEYGKK